MESRRLKRPSQKFWNKKIIYLKVIKFLKNWYAIYNLENKQKTSVPINWVIDLLRYNWIMVIYQKAIRAYPIIVCTQ